MCYHTETCYGNVYIDYPSKEVECGGSLHRSRFRQTFLFTANAFLGFLGSLVALETDSKVSDAQTHNTSVRPIHLHMHRAAALVHVPGKKET